MSRSASPRTDTHGSALSKSMSILDAIARSATPLSLAELELQLPMPKTSLHRYLGQLEDSGLIIRDIVGRRYTVGPRLQSLALTALSVPVAAFSTRPILERLVDEIGESVNLGLRMGAQIAYIDRVECNWGLRTHFSPGSRVPIHCTAIGKIFLAHMELTQRTRLLTREGMAAYTGSTRTTPEALEPDLQRVLGTGVGVNDQEFMVGLIGVGVPIFHDGRLVAGVAIHAPIPRMTAEEALEHIPTLKRAAAEIEAQIDAET